MRRDKKKPADDLPCKITLPAVSVGAQARIAWATYSYSENLNCLEMFACAQARSELIPFTLSIGEDM
jgi:hypothetical protein